MFSFLHCAAGCNKQLQLFQFAGRGQFWSCLQSKTGLRRVRCCQKANKSSRHGLSGISPSRKLIRPCKIGIPQFIGHFVLVGAGNTSKLIGWSLLVNRRRWILWAGYGIPVWWLSWASPPMGLSPCLCTSSCKMALYMINFTVWINPYHSRTFRVPN